MCPRSGTTSDLICLDPGITFPRRVPFFFHPWILFWYFVADCLQICTVIQYCSSVSTRYYVTASRDQEWLSFFMLPFLFQTFKMILFLPKSQWKYITLQFVDCRLPIFSNFLKRITVTSYKFCIYLWDQLVDLAVGTQVQWQTGLELALLTSDTGIIQKSEE